MKNNILTLIFLISILVLQSCEKEIDFKYNYIPPIPVIEGCLSSDEAKIGITYTTPMNEHIDLTRITDASVRIKDCSTGVSYTLSVDKDNYFVNKMRGIPGHEYLLEVEMAMIRYSMTTKMFAPVEIISAEFNWIHMPYDDVAVLQCLYKDRPDIDGEYYWVRVYRNGEIYMWSEQSDRTANNSVMNFFAMTSRRDLNEEDEDSALRDGDLITIVINGISKEMHDYLEALSNDSSGPRLFKAEQINSSDSTNDQNKYDKESLDIGCLGYFMASTPASISIVFHPDDIPMASPK